MAKKIELDEHAVLSVLKEHLGIKVSSGGFTDPNQRRIDLVWRSESGEKSVIASAEFDVVSKPEYEG